MSKIINLNDWRLKKMFDFVIHMSCYHPIKNTADIKEYLLSDYNATDDETAFGRLKKQVLVDIDVALHVYWISASLIYNPTNTQPQCIYRMQGDKTWFSNIEYFRKFQGDMGGSIAESPLSHGFIDKLHNIRVEFENGIVQLSHLN